jgi:hypothetical protein
MSANNDNQPPTPPRIGSGTGRLRKIRDLKPPCFSPEHNPPLQIVLEPGEYEYVCPSCGNPTTFIVPMVVC